MFYHFGHIVLYRPFLHYLAKARSETPPDPRQLGYALQCINTAQSAISCSEKVLQQGFLSPASWACAYTVFLSVVCLTFFLASHGESQQAVMVRQAVESGIKILASTSCQDTGSRRCLDVLKVCQTFVFQSLLVVLSIRQTLLTRLSGVIDVDVERLEMETLSLCRATSPGDTYKKAGSGSSDTVQAHLNCIPSGPTDSHNIPWQRSQQQCSYPSSQRQQPGSTESNTSVFQSDPQIQAQGTQYSGSIYDASSTSAEASSNQPYQWYFDSALPSHQHPQMEMYQELPDNMEILYAQDFAWPSQDMADPYYDISQGAENQGQSTETRAPPYVKSADIAAFMRINPAEHPFR